MFTGTGTTYTYDKVSRLTRMDEVLAGTSHDLTLDFTHNPAGQIATNTRSNDSYAWAGHYAVDRPYTANGLNQYSAAGAASFGHDSNGNLTSDGTRVRQREQAGRGIGLATSVFPRARA